MPHILSFARCGSQSTSFRGVAPAAPAKRPVWRDETEKIRTSIDRIENAVAQLRARHPESAISADFSDLRKRLEKAERKIRSGPLGGLVGDGPVARCFKTRRKDAENAIGVLRCLAQAAKELADDVDDAVRGDHAAGGVDGRILVKLRAAERGMAGDLDAARGKLPKEPTRFKLRTAAMVMGTMISVIGTILGATVSGPLLLIPLTVATIGFAISMSSHFALRRDTGWKALTQLIDQFATTRDRLHFDALLDANLRLIDVNQAMFEESRAFRANQIALNAETTVQSAKNAATITTIEHQLACRETDIVALRRNVEELQQEVMRMTEQIGGNDGLAPLLEQLALHVRALRGRQAGAEAPDDPAGAMSPEIPGIPRSVEAALGRDPSAV